MGVISLHADSSIERNGFESFYTAWILTKHKIMDILRTRFCQSKVTIEKMVDIVQLVERQIVVLDVAGSSPVIHPERMKTF